MKRHQRRLWLTLAAGVLLLGNLSIAAPAFADPATTASTSEQTTAVSQRQTASTASSTSQASAGDNDQQVAAKVDN